MSVIAIIIDSTEVNPKVIINIQKLTGVGISKIRQNIANKKPIFEKELFNSNYDNNSLMIREIIFGLKSGNIPLCIYELPEGKSISLCSFPNNYLISSDVLFNILDQADNEFEC